MVKNPSLSEQLHLKKKWARTKYKIKKVKRNFQLATTLYLATGNRIYLTIAIHCHQKMRRLKRHLRSVAHPFSIRRILPEYKRLDFSSFGDHEFRDTFRFSKTLCTKLLNYLTRFRGFGPVVRVRKGQSNACWTFSTGKCTC